MKFSLFAIVCLNGLTLISQAQTGSFAQWHHLDPTIDQVIGISTDRAYQLLETLPKPAKSVTVAVIDGSVDLSHEDLQAARWTNPKELAGNGKDDDGNGYMDDIHGWNFLGNKQGQNLEYIHYEVTRLYARLKSLYEKKNRSALTPTQQREYDQWLVVKPYYETKRAEVEKRYQNDVRWLETTKADLASLKKAFGVDQLDSLSLLHPPTTDSSLIQKARRIYGEMTWSGLYKEGDMIRYLEQYNARLKSSLEYINNPTINDFALVGDDPADLLERNYGNAILTADLLHDFHSTHITGIIAADRTNNIGVKGVAAGVRVLWVRAAMHGDERDKDVANAIRYAVDNGAKVINMSFGKYFSPDRVVVEQAIQYADRKGVLLVCGAGNDQLNLDSAQSYPSPRYLSGQLIPNLITVGASAQHNDSSLVAGFSNYSAHKVDVFAPGVQIWSCRPGNRYQAGSGTSYSTPIVVGVAAVLKTYFPHLVPADLKRIILQSGVVYHTPVLKPGTRHKVDFASLSKTGAIVNLYEAVKLAMREQAATK